MPHMSHKIKHKTHKLYYKCKNPLMNTYVDDCYTVIITKSNTIWKLVKEYIKKMNQYYIDNQLKMNVKKTMVMIITDKQEEKDNTIIVDGNIIKHEKKIKILGTMFNEKLN